jgi:hypothetical protein
VSNTVIIILVSIAGVLIVGVVGAIITSIFFWKHVVPAIRRFVERHSSGHNPSNQPVAQSTATTTQTTPPPPPPAPAPTKKKHGFWYWMAAILVCAVIIGAVCVGSILIKHFASGSKGPIDWSLSGPTLPPPPNLNCPGWWELDAKGAEDHSKDDVKKPVYIKTVPVPGSEQKLCWSTWVVLPPYKVEWHVKFLNEDPTKDRCVAYVKYEGIARVWGPYTGTMDIGENNMPKNNGFRLATTCKIYVYGE